MTLFWLLITSWCTKIGFQAMMLIKGHILLCLYLFWIFLSFQQGLIWPQASTHNFYGCRGRQAFWHMLCRVITNSVSGTQLCWGCCSLSQTLHVASGCWHCSPPCCVSTLTSLAGPNQHSYCSAFPPALLWHQQHGLLGFCAQPPLCPMCRWLLVVMHPVVSMCSLDFGRSWRLLLIKQRMEFKVALSAWLTLLGSQVIH